MVKRGGVVEGCSEGWREAGVFDGLQEGLGGEAAELPVLEAEA